MGNLRTIIVGGGMAGLAAARTLQPTGADWILLEAGERLGGRIASERVAGFILDRGFQVLNSAYSTVRRLVDFRQLQLRPFMPGARVYGGGRTMLYLDPRRAPPAAWRLGPPVVPSAGDALRILRLLREAGTSARQVSAPVANVAVLAELKRRGFSQQLINWFFQPFFAGVFLDPDLATSWRCLVNQFYYFAWGQACLPIDGMTRLPELLAENLPAARIKLGSRVVDIEPGTVVTEDGVFHEYDRLILALELTEYEKLIGRNSGRRMRGVSCFYFAAPEAPYKEPLLSLAAADEPGPVATVAVLTNLHPDFAADGRALISVSVLGSSSGSDHARKIIDQLSDWYGAEVRQWELIKQFTIPHALPDQSPESLAGMDQAPDLGNRVFPCGDHTVLPSIEGAAASGVRAAKAVLAEIMRS